jgi:hypothetical protein
MLQDPRSSKSRSSIRGEVGACTYYIQQLKGENKEKEEIVRIQILISDPEISS